MKKLISFVLMLAVSLAALTVTAFCADPAVFPAMATNNTIVVSSGTDQPDAHVVSPAVYKIDGANYFRLRDVAMLLNGSEKQFAVEYDEAEKTVSLTSGQPYRAVGGELSGTASETVSASPTNNAILIGGEIVTLTVYKIDGANYFRLRDLGQALDFHVGYDDETKTVFLSGSGGYEEETASEELPFEAQIIRTDGYHDGATYPRTLLIDSAEELNRYLEENRELYDFGHKDKVYADTTTGFVDAIKGYDGAWFRDHQLILVLLEEGSGSVRHAVTAVKGGEKPEVTVTRLVPEVGTDDMAEWHILIGIDRNLEPGTEIAVSLITRQDGASLAD